MRSIFGRKGSAGLISEDVHTESKKCQGVDIPRRRTPIPNFRPMNRAVGDGCERPAGCARASAGVDPAAVQRAACSA